MIKKLFQTHECITEFANNMVLNGVIQCIHEKINEFINQKNESIIYTPIIEYKIIKNKEFT